MSQLKVLFVEDDQELLASYVDGLSLTYDVKGHSDSNNIPQADLEWADVLIADFNMPGRNGVEVMQDMMADGCENPVIFVTGFVSDLLKNLKTVHTVEVLEKPVGIETLSKYINLYGGFKVQLLKQQASLMSEISDSRELAKRVTEFNEIKLKMLKDLRAEADNLANQ
ncbi:MAG: response regulator [Bdellovibrionales bacterium]|nr:response regulator [Bdellovibrionales bacterium]